MKKFAILVDSISTIGTNENPSLDDVYVLPLGLTSPDGKNIQDYTSGISINEILESAKQKKYYKTSTTKVGVFFDMIDELLNNYECVIYLAISSELSSQFHNLSKLIELDDKYKDKVWMINTLSAGYSIEQMVKDILDVISLKGDITIRQIEDIVRVENNTSSEYIICKNLLGVNEGGRITKTFIKILDKLAKVPIILFEKKNILKSLARDYDKAFLKIIKYVTERTKKTNTKITEMCFVYTDEYSKKKIEQFILQAKELFNLTDNKITTRRIMFPVVTHTLFDTMCFYFKFD